MFLLIIFLMCIFITLGIGALAALSDVRSLTIPNMHSVVIILAFAVAFGAIYVGGGPTGVFGSFTSHLISAGITFAVTAVMFAARMIGAGDSKFATACALWFSPHNLAMFLFFMTLGGAVLGAVALYVQRKKPFKEPPVGGWIEQVQGGASKVPYGVAITFGMLIAFYYSGYFSADVMTTFLSFVDVPTAS